MKANNQNKPESPFTKDEVVANIECTAQYVTGRDEKTNNDIWKKSRGVDVRVHKNKYK